MKYSIITPSHPTVRAIRAKRLRREAAITRDVESFKATTLAIFAAPLTETERAWFGPTVNSTTERVLYDRPWLARTDVAAMSHHAPRVQPTTIRSVFRIAWFGRFGRTVGA